MSPLGLPFDTQTSLFKEPIALVPFMTARRTWSAPDIASSPRIIRQANANEENADDAFLPESLHLEPSQEGRIRVQCRIVSPLSLIVSDE